MKKIAIDTIAVLLIILFIYGGLIKWLDYSTFRGQLAVYPLLAPFAGIITWLLPAAELVIAFLLIGPRTRMMGFSLSLLLMVMFTGYIIFLLNTGHNVPCACERLLGFASWQAQLKFNMIFLLIALLGFLLQLVARQEAKKLRAAGYKHFLFQRQWETGNL